MSVELDHICLLALDTVTSFATGKIFNLLLINKKHSSFVFFIFWDLKHDNVEVYNIFFSLKKE